ncbi:TOMM precursor leader peptide-binding protein [candidate division NPL-UPA2 bacterium]|nr:TOMM precursor leader peptide-binding protein [candidate division NPL-UPA2 bacterium]
MVDGKRSTAEITKQLSHKYPLEDIDNFLAALIKTEIIVDKSGNYSESGQEVLSTIAEVEIGRSIVLIGRGKIAEAIQEKLNEKDMFPDYHDINSDALCSSIDSDGEWEEPSADVFKKILKECGQCIVIACPDKCTFGWLMALNDACLSLNIPFILCYYNGKNILLGPMVIPGKPPCYSCLLEHRRSFIAEKSEVELTHKQLLALLESWPIQKNQFDEAIITWVANYVVTEVNKIVQEYLPTTLLKTQIMVPPFMTHQFQEVSFELTTSCPSCSGMNEKNLFLGDPVQSYPSVNENNRIIITDQPVVYEKGGRRSIAAAEAMEMVERALFSSDLKVKFEKQSSGSLDGTTLFRYIATPESKYNSHLPLLDSKFQSRGKGVTEEQAYLSAAFELFERISSRYFGHEEIVRASYREVEDTAINLQACIGKTFHDGVMDSFEKEAPIDWVWGYSLSHQCPRLVPASMVFLSKGKFAGHFFDISSSGLAAGATIEDAILQGLLELVEHDAWMIWQANTITVPKIQLDTIKTPRLARILTNAQSCGLRVIIRNYTTEFSIPVFRTWMVNDHDYSCYATNGFGANLDPDVALERSISEAWQSTEMDREEEQLSYRGPCARDLVFSYFSLYSLYYFNRLEIMNNGQSLNYNQFENKATDSVGGDIRKIMSYLQSSIPDVDVVVVDLTKEVFNVPAVRVIVSGGLQRSGEPNLSISRRLFELPKMLGYRQNKLTYKELYNGVYPH